MSGGNWKEMFKAACDGDLALPVNMRAWVCPAYGGPEVLTLCARPVPKLAPHQLLVKVEATSVEISDVRIRSQHFPRGFAFIGRLVFGWRRPRQPVLGSVLAGTVVAVGSRVQRWAVGQRIVATTGLRAGAHAESAVLSEKSAIVPCPPALTSAQAVALVFGGLTAQYFLDRAALRPQEKVLVIGATGSVGNALLQMARARGAEVTALSSGPNLPLARELGATHALDYRLHPPASLPAHGFDVVADTCAAASLLACLPLLRAGGRYLNIAGDLQSMLTRARHGRRSISGTSREHAQDLQRVMDLAAAGVLKPLIDSVWSFAELPAAHARAGSGHKRSCVVVQVSELGEAQAPVEVGTPVHEAFNRFVGVQASLIKPENASMKITTVPFPSLRTSLVIFRVGVPILFMAHAVVRIVNGTTPQFAAFLGGIGFPQPLAVVWAITLTELVAGTMLALGYRQRMASIALASIAAGGIALIHYRFGWFVGEHGSGGSEYSVSLLLSLLVLAAADPKYLSARRDAYQESRRK